MYRSKEQSHMTERSPIVEVIIATSVVILINALGGAPAVIVGSDTDWIDRPWFYPPEIVFPIVWTVLFTLMGISLYLVARAGLHRYDVRRAIGAFGIQFLLNLAWTPIFFGLRRPDLGLIVIIVLWVAIALTIRLFDRVDRRAAILLIPYFLWVGFAFVLSIAIFLEHL